MNNMINDPKKIKKGTIGNKLLRICQHCVGNSFCKFCEVNVEDDLDKCSYYLSLVNFKKHIKEKHPKCVDFCNFAHGRAAIGNKQKQFFASQNNSAGDGLLLIISYLFRPSMALFAE
jgi:hypothetical protein